MPGVVLLLVFSMMLLSILAPLPLLLLLLQLSHQLATTDGSSKQLQLAAELMTSAAAAAVAAAAWRSSKAGPGCQGLLANQSLMLLLLLLLLTPPSALLLPLPLRLWLLLLLILKGCWLSWRSSGSRVTACRKQNRSVRYVEPRASKLASGLARALCLFASLSSACVGCEKRRERKPAGSKTRSVNSLADGLLTFKCSGPSRLESHASQYSSTTRSTAA
jgi:hypothetical protein